MAELPKFLEPLDPAKNFIVAAFGRKGSGKTSFNRALYQSYPHSKLCIDVNGQAQPGPDALRVRDLSAAMPEPEPGKPAPNLHFVADPGSPNYRDDLDAAIGMAMYPTDRHALVWGGEVGELTTGNKTGPHLRRLLMQSRHYRTSALFDGPRPMDIDKLVIDQADLVAVFDMPDPADQDRVASTIGWPPKTFRAECNDTFVKGPYWHLIYDARSKLLFQCPPLPNI